ncbi:MAG: AhpC/TSA family protein, partial [Chitinophagaceae bacterium]
SFDDPLVIRFLIDPAEINISFDPKNPAEIKITGSPLQAEFDRYQGSRQHLIQAKEQNYKDIDRHNALPESKKSMAAERGIAKRRDSIFDEIKKMDVAYIQKNPGSFLSPYLLSHNRRRLPADSLGILYDNLNPEVKQSSVAKVALKDIYPIVDDPKFRMSNPLNDSATEAAIAKMKTVHELVLPDTSGNPVNFSGFKGKYIFLDFWASWCTPCIGEIPSLHGLMTLYRNDPIQFVSISLDHDSAAWKKSIVLNSFRGVQVNDKHAFKSVVAVFNKVLWVPRYVLIDPEGKVINYGMPFPSEPELKKLLDTHLKKGS